MMKSEIKERIEQVRQGEVPEGFTYTRAMISPRHWPIVPLNSVLRENKDRNEEGLFDKEDVLSVSGESGIVNQIKFMGRSYAGESVRNYHVVYPGNIVYTKSPLKENPYGIIKLNKGDVGLVSTLYAVYHCESPITGLYLNYYFSVDKYLNNYLKPLVKKGAKNDMKVNNEDAIKGFIPLPSIAEQEKIAEILTQCDKIIEMKKHLVESKNHRKKWLMENLLNPDSGLRLPGFEGEWNYVCLQDIVQVSRSKVNPTNATKEYNCIELEHIESNTGKILGWVNSSGQLSTKNKFSKGDLLFGKLRPYLRKVALAPFDGVCSGEIWPLKVHGSDINNVYMLYYMKTDSFIAVANTTTGTKMPRADWSLLCDHMLAVPEIREQIAIANVLSTADREIDFLEQEISQWKAKKKALMQLLLTGIVRVNV